MGLYPLGLQIQSNITVVRGGSRKFTLVGLWNRARLRAESFWGHAHLIYFGVTLTAKRMQSGIHANLLE